MPHPALLLLARCRSSFSVRGTEYLFLFLFLFLPDHFLVAGLVFDLRLLIGDGFDWIELGRDTLYGMGNVETGPSVDETTNNGMDRMEI